MLSRDADNAEMGSGEMGGRRSANKRKKADSVVKKRNDLKDLKRLR
jgi:hypothetical protein